MARMGVTYQHVAEAATQLTSQDVQPTIELIRHLLGTGSSTTIATHLKKWRARQNKGEPLLMIENIPAELSAVIKQIWEQLCEEANEKIRQNELQHTENLIEKERELEKYKKNNRRWQQLYHHWHQEKINLINHNADLIQDLEQRKNENTHLQVQHDNDLMSLKNKNEQIQKLQLLLTQTQQNFEKHLESERQHIQKTMAQINELTAQNKKQETEINQLNEINQHLNHENQIIKKQYIQIETKFVIQNELIKKFDEDKQSFIAINHYLQQHNLSLQKKLEDKLILLSTSEATIKIFEKQLAEYKQSFLDLQKQTKEIENAKWQMTKEKDRLEEKIKRIELKGGVEESL